MLVEAKIWTVAKTDQGNAVLVKPVTEEKAVPIFIGPLEAQNILLGLGEVEIPRPLTHDLMLHMLRELKTSLVRVVIHTLSEGTYYANLVLEQDGRLVEIDARPSDGLALAVRASCSIWIESALVEEAGIDIDQLQQAAPPGGETDEMDSVDERESALLDEEEPEAEQILARLKEQLEALVAQENYEEAARVRDEIRRRETRNNG